MVKFVPGHAIRAQTDVQLHSFLTSLMDGWKWLTSRSGRFAPRRHNPRYPLIRMQGGSHGQSGPSNDWQAKFYCMYLTQLDLFRRMGLSTYTLHQTIVIFSTQAGWDGRGMRGARDVHNCRWKTWRQETSWKTGRLWEVSVKVNLEKRNRWLQITKLVLLV